MGSWLCEGGGSFCEGEGEGEGGGWFCEGEGGG
jgi:hypothetical protein